MRVRSTGFVLALFLVACGGGGDSAGGGGVTSGPPPITADISLLFMGNSHTSFDDLSTMVAARSA